jgi:hypothetical protein
MYVRLVREFARAKSHWRRMLFADVCRGFHGTWSTAFFRASNKTNPTTFPRQNFWLCPYGFPLIRLWPRDDQSNYVTKESLQVPGDPPRSLTWGLVPCQSLARTFLNFA